MTMWPSVTLADVATIDRSSVQPQDIEAGTLYVGLEDIEGRTGKLTPHPVDAGVLASSKFSFSGEHILYGKLRPYLAKIACPDFIGICSTDILPILPGPRIDRRYLFHFVRRPESVAFAAAQASGANLPRLSPSALEAFQLRLPPLSEQRRIAHMLDQVDALRAKRRATLALLDSLTSAIFLEMFGELVKKGATVPLSDCAEVVSGVAKGRKLAGRGAVQVPYLRVANVQAGFLNLDEIKMIEALPSEIEELRLLPGDLVLTEGGDFDKLGRGALWNGQIEECIHQNHVFRVRLDKSQLLPRFVHEYLQSDEVRAYFLRCAKRTTNLASINMGQLRALPVVVPPLGAQQRFIDRALGIESLRERARLAATTLDELFASLQDRAFNGELVEPQQTTV